jgi:hypothetical protein
MSDFNNKKAEDSPCAKYVRDVLSKIWTYIILPKGGNLVKI